MLLKLLLLFIFVPLIELSLLLIIGQLTERWYVPVIIVVVSGVIGATLAQQQGYRTIQRIRQDLAERKIPTDSLLDAVMILFAGALLLTPGVLTDAFGMSLLIPPCRRFLKPRLLAWLKSKFKITSFGTTEQPSSQSVVLDSYVVDSENAHDDSVD